MDISSLIALGLSILGTVLSIVAIAVTWISSKTDRTNENNWQTYTIYNSDDIKRGRAAARAVGNDPNWKNVKDLKAYRAFLKKDLEAATKEDHEEKERLAHLDQDLHYLLGYYHQVGLLLEQKLLDEDFTMLLLGEGLADRWDALAPVPLFYKGSSYGGMYQLYGTYRKWLVERFPQLMPQSVAIRQAAAKERGIIEGKEDH